MKRDGSGFTLVELMITVAVLAILLAVGIPAMQSFVVANRLTAINNDLMTALTLTRSEAIKRATDVTVCSSNDETDCGGTWNDGWIVFVDPSGRGDRDLAAVPPETLLRVFPGPPSGYTVAENFTTDYVTYNRSGAANLNGSFFVCHNNDTATARGITLTRLRPRVVPDIGACGP